MPRLRKPELLDLVESAIRDSGWNILFLAARRSHPARLMIVSPTNKVIKLRIYIWNLTHGGGAARAQNEWRIQITGVPSFEPEPGGKTLILGWWEQGGVFAAWDYRRHSGALGSSPSFQIGLEALEKAARENFATHRKQTGELAVSFEPSFMTTYAEFAEDLHDSGAAPAEVALLDRISPLDSNPATEAEIEEEVSSTREYAFVTTRKALRDISFRHRVMAAYGRRCAMCGVQLRLIDAAHIMPVAEPRGTDKTNNGVALCALHHRAYDHGLVAFNTEYAVLLSRDRLEKLKSSNELGGLPAFQKSLRSILLLPPTPRDRPRSDLISAANKLRGWTS